MSNPSTHVLNEMKKVMNGKDDVIQNVWMTFLAGGHVLLEDLPGVGKTTLAKAFSRVVGLDSNRIQFTPDVVASDVIGFTMFDKEKNEFVFKEGAVMCNLLLGDEINRTSSRTQAALLEAMQEKQVTVDGVTYPLPAPFHVIATQNPYGTIGTQPLPTAQLDRFMTKLSVGYPDFEDQVAMLRNRQQADPLSSLTQIITKNELLALQHQVQNLFIDDEILRYVTALTEKTRNHSSIHQGISPRGALALCQMAKAHAFLQQRDYVIPEDVQAVWLPTSRHRIVMSGVPGTAHEQDALLENLLHSVATPDQAMLATF
ncbi:AAA family ATPase [Sporosarcina sp. P34]|uniref:AAA family ATPase n=1 Tax=Sporosarcina sp. P34 TaxID=2048247 RepID=UPI000C1696B2|nr:MoxR family ATPase [Sporosarcina sp. P34]PID13878.1 AAA family ATPase [Sporosarcina sp. P34]